ncbi:hypothetical protein ACWIGI_07710 [Nocardia sp. NPDC055321]
MMIKLFSAAALTATAATVLLLPAAPAQARSLTCDRAIEFINAAIDASGGTYDDATALALADRLRTVALVSGGEEQAAIYAYADALVDDNITDLTPFTDELNRTCA